MEGLLFVILSENPTCHHLNQLRNEIIIDKNIFNAYENDNFSGFYDWLRNSFGNIIGLRYTRLGKFKLSMLNALKKSPSVYFIEDEIMEIYFGSTRDYIEDISNDQDIGTCKIYMALDLTFAILLDILYLTNDEFSSISLS
jgi:hypothetical protein